MLLQFVGFWQAANMLFEFQEETGNSEGLIVYQETQRTDMVGITGVEYR